MSPINRRGPKIRSPLQRQVTVVLSDDQYDALCAFALKRGKLPTVQEGIRLAADRLAVAAGLSPTAHVLLPSPVPRLGSRKRSRKKATAPIPEPVLVPIDIPLATAPVT